MPNLLQALCTISTLIVWGWSCPCLQMPCCVTLDRLIPSPTCGHYLSLLPNMTVGKKKTSAIMYKLTMIWLPGQTSWTLTLSRGHMTWKGSHSELTASSTTSTDLPSCLWKSHGIASMSVNSAFGHGLCEGWTNDSSVPFNPIWTGWPRVAASEVCLPCAPASYLHRKTVRGRIMSDSLYLKEVSIYRNPFRVSGIFLHREREATKWEGEIPSVFKRKRMQENQRDTLRICHCSETATNFFQYS